MDVTWLFTIPAAGLGFCAGWIAKPARGSTIAEVDQRDTPEPGISCVISQRGEPGELEARLRDLELRTHAHAPAEQPRQAPPPHGPDYEAWGHNPKTGEHWRRHVNGTIEHSPDGKW